MLLVKDVEVKEVPEADAVENFRLDSDKAAMPIELSYSKVFRDGNGQPVRIALSRKVEQAIGLPLRTFESLQGQVTRALDAKAEWRKRFNSFAFMGFFGRLKFLFFPRRVTLKIKTDLMGN